MNATTSRLLTLSASLALAMPLLAQVRNVSGGVLIAEQACYDVTHYDLVLAVERIVVGGSGS